MDAVNLGVHVGGKALPLPLPRELLSEFNLEPAPFGKGAETVLDEKVRKCLQSRDVEFRHPNAQRWIQELAHNAAVQLAYEGGVEAKFHKLLVYGRDGDFFEKHQDAVHVDGAFGSLVVQLPSVFEGNELVVTHGDKELSFFERGTSFDVEWCAFYGDCPHEVRPLKSGCRVVLTFDLIRVDKDHGAEIPAPIPPPPSMADELRKFGFGVILCKHFYPAFALRPLPNGEWEGDRILSVLRGVDQARIGALVDALDPAEFVVGLRHLTVELEQEYESSPTFEDMTLLNATAHISRGDLVTESKDVSRYEVLWPSSLDEIEKETLSYTLPAAYVGNGSQSGDCTLLASAFFFCPKSKWQKEGSGEEEGEEREEREETEETSHTF